MDVAHQLVSEIFHRRKDAARDHLTFNASKPDLYLIEPGGIGRCEMQLHVEMLVKKLLHLGCFVGGQIVQNDVDLLLALAFANDLLEEGHEFVTGMPGSRFTVHLPGFHI